MFTRTRYQYGSLETKERKKGREVWEFRYYEPDARGERQRRAVMVGTREEYPTESAARKSPVVQAILLRLNAEQPSAAGAANFGAVIARYEQEEMPERYSTSAAYKSYIPNQLDRVLLDQFPPLRTLKNRVHKTSDETLGFRGQSQVPQPSSTAIGLTALMGVSAQRGLIWFLAPQNASRPSS